MTIRDDHWSAVGWLVSALEHEHPGFIAGELQRATDAGYDHTAAGLRQMHAMALQAQSSDRAPRERAVPCRVIGCPALTFNWQAMCGRHLESDEPTAPRRLEAVVDGPSAGLFDEQAPTGSTSAGRGHPLTA